MSNRIDFYQAKRNELAMAAGAAVVFVEGRMRPELEVMEIVQGGMGKFGSAKIRGVLGIENEIETGTNIEIKWTYGNLYPAGGAEGIVIFSGQAESVDRTLETTEIEVRDYSAALERITVFGRRIKDIDGRIVFIESDKTIFNEGGLPNATDELIEWEGDEIRLFAADTRTAAFWDCADVIRYLLCEYLPAGQLVIPDELRLRALFEEQSVRDLNVTGLSVLEAIEKCCEQAGVEFKFMPMLNETGPKQSVAFYRKGRGRIVELNLQKAGEKASVSKTNIFKASARGNYRPVTHRYIGLGDYKVFEATFNLVETWRPEQESIDYDKFSPSTNPDFYQVRNVHRRFCLNEAGDFSAAPYNQGPAYDFSQIFGTVNFVHKQRRFWPAISCDIEGKSLGYVLEVSYDNGENWWQYMFAFDILLDECGIWLSSNKLDMNTWVAALKNVLKFRITASVASDERLSCTIADGPVGATAPVEDKVIEAANRFKYRKVTSQSKFAGLSSDSIGLPDEADDTAALNQYIRQMVTNGPQAIETFDVQTSFLSYGFEVGDRVVSNPDCRDIFSTTSDNRSVCTIESVRMDFLKQSTELKVMKRRIYE